MLVIDDFVSSFDIFVLSMMFDTHTLCVSLMTFFIKLSSIAYKHGNSDYIIDTTHPTSDDYLKFVEEAQASLKSGKTRYLSI